MAIFALAGATFAIGTTKAAADATTFAADTYSTVGEAESITDFGDTATDVAFTGLTDARTQHLKGTVDGGTMTLVCARDDADAGQAALLAAFDSNLDYNFKITWNNAITPTTGTKGVTYWRGKVMERKLTNGSGPNNVMKRTFMISVNTAQVDVAAT